MPKTNPLWPSVGWHSTKWPPSGWGPLPIWQPCSLECVGSVSVHFFSSRLVFWYSSGCMLCVHLYIYYIISYTPPSLAGCEDLASQFLSQEIDGQALMLLKEEHLMSTMNIKLGPALKICASINSLKDWTRDGGREVAGLEFYTSVTSLGNCNWWAWKDIGFNGWPRD